MRIPRLIPFYGAKHSISGRYPAPKYSTIIEPFAGSAGYSSRYSDRNVILCDIDPTIIGIWDWLTNTTKQDILDLPLIDIGQHVDTLDTHAAAKDLIGFWCNPGTAAPCNLLSSFAIMGMTDPQHAGRILCAGWHGPQRARVANSVAHIQHWQVILGNYYELPNIQATWFIDPPYNNPAGRYYKYNSINYDQLAQWCLSRKGQVIVCENDGATWLPFEPFASINGQKGASAESIWYSEHNNLTMVEMLKCELAV